MNWRKGEGPRQAQQDELLELRKQSNYCSKWFRIQMQVSDGRFRIWKKKKTYLGIDLFCQHQWFSDCGWYEDILVGWLYIKYHINV